MLEVADIEGRQSGGGRANRLSMSLRRWRPPGAHTLGSSCPRVVSLEFLKWGRTRGASRKCVMRSALLCRQRHENPLCACGQYEVAGLAHKAGAVGIGTGLGVPVYRDNDITRGGSYKRIGTMSDLCGESGVSTLQRANRCLDTTRRPVWSFI